jgi:flagellar basal-body rod modification protein FlgD
MSPLATDSTTNSSNSSDGTSKSSSSTTITKDMFLQLLVAQLKNQDPMSPADGTQFLTQLAQFEQLEQSMNTGEDVASILTDVNQLVGSSSSSSS